METVTVRTDAGEKTVPRLEVIAKLNAKTAQVRAAERAQGAQDFEDPQRKLLVKYPRLMAHLICQSLGYFCPRSAANALLSYQDSKPFFCEWYCHMAGGYSATRLVEIGADTLRRAVAQRHSHKGYMSEYISGRLVVLQELAGHGPELASWF